MARQAAPKPGRKRTKDSIKSELRARLRSSSVVDEGVDDSGSLIVRRGEFASRTGLAFQNPLTGNFKRDYYDALGYARRLRVADYRARYHRGGIAERLIEAYPRGTWSGGADIQEEHDPEIETKFEKQAADLFDKLQIWTVLMRADILAGIGRYSVLLIGTKKGGSDLSQPLPKMSSPDDVIYLTPLAEDNAKIQTTVDDPRDPRFGLPLIYSCDLSKKKSTMVHWSRLIHIAEGLTDNHLYGKPRLRAVWNYLDDLQKVIGGGAEAAWKRMDPGLHLNMDPQLEIDDNEEQALDDMVDEYLHGYRRVLQTRGVDLQMLAAQVASFGPNAQVIIDLIAGTTGTPKRILIGSERGELASKQDQDNWADRVAERRREFAIPVAREFLDRLIQYGALDKPKQYEIVWPETELSPVEKANVAATIASANNHQAMAEGTVLMTSDEVRDKLWGLEPLEDDQRGKSVYQERLPGNGPGQGDQVGGADSGQDGPTITDPKMVANAGAKVLYMRDSRYQSQLKAKIRCSAPTYRAWVNA